MFAKRVDVEKGFVSIEAALIVPFFLFVVALLAQLALLAIAHTAVQGAAENSAEVAAQFGVDKNRGHTAAKEAAKKIPGLQNSKSTIVYSENAIAVQVTGEPFKILPVNFRVSAEVNVPIERVVSSSGRY